MQKIQNHSNRNKQNKIIGHALFAMITAMIIERDNFTLNAKSVSMEVIFSILKNGFKRVDIARKMIAHVFVIDLSD